MEVTVSGKRVRLRDRLPARECWPLIQAVRKAQQGQETTFDEGVQAIMPMVESWDFDGDPHDGKAYEWLDLLTEFIPLGQLVGSEIVNRLAASKNSIKPPTSR